VGSQAIQHNNNQLKIKTINCSSSQYTLTKHQTIWFNNQSILVSWSRIQQQKVIN